MRILLLPSLFCLLASVLAGCAAPNGKNQAARNEPGRHRQHPAERTQRGEQCAAASAGCGNAQGGE